MTIIDTTEAPQPLRNALDVLKLAIAHLVVQGKRHLAHRGGLVSSVTGRDCGHAFQAVHDELMARLHACHSDAPERRSLLLGLAQGLALSPTGGTETIFGTFLRLSWTAVSIREGGLIAFDYDPARAQSEINLRSPADNELAAVLAEHLLPLCFPRA